MIRGMVRGYASHMANFHPLLNLDHLKKAHTLMPYHGCLESVGAALPTPSFDHGTHGLPCDGLKPKLPSPASQKGKWSNIFFVSFQQRGDERVDSFRYGNTWSHKCPTSPLPLLFFEGGVYIPARSILGPKVPSIRKRVWNGRD